MPFTYPLLDRIKQRAQEDPYSLAILDRPRDLRVSYGQLLSDVTDLAGVILQTRGVEDLKEMRVLIIATKGYLVPISLLAVWAAGGIALPVLPAQPIPEQAYQLENAGADLILTDVDNFTRAKELQQGAKKNGLDAAILQLPSTGGAASSQPTAAPQWAELHGDRRALMLYTSGTVCRIYR